MIVAAFCLAYVGWTALSTLQPRHAQAIGWHPTTRLARLVTCAVGYGALGLSLIACCAAWEPAMGAVGWFGVLTASGLVLVLLLAFKPRLAAMLAPAALAVGVIAFV